MKYSIKIKTTRTKYGTANATVSYYYNYSRHEFRWAFNFYNDFKTFGTEEELLEYVNSKYEIVK